MKFLLYFFFVFLFLYSPVAGQNTYEPARHGIQMPAGLNSMMFSADYSSNTNVMGIFNTNIKQPSFSPSLSFYSKWGADVSVIGYSIDNSDDSLTGYTAELDLIAGYTLEIAKTLTIYPSYGHYFYSHNSNALNALFTDDIRVDADYNHKFFNLGASAGYFMGKRNVFYMALHNNYRLTIDHFPFRQGSLLIQPGIDANFGSYEYLNLYYVDELRKDPAWFYYLFAYPGIRHYIEHEKKRHPDYTVKDILFNYLEQKADDNFKLTSVMIDLPVYLATGNFMVNFGIYSVIPVGQPEYMIDEVQFYFNIGISYNFTFR